MFGMALVMLGTHIGNIYFQPKGTIVPVQQEVDTLHFQYEQLQGLPVSPVNEGTFTFLIGEEYLTMISPTFEEHFEGSYDNKNKIFYTKQNNMFIVTDDAIRYINRKYGVEFLYFNKMFTSKEVIVPDDATEYIEEFNVSSISGDTLFVERDFEPLMYALIVPSNIPARLYQKDRILVKYSYMKDRAYLKAISIHKVTTTNKKIFSNDDQN